MSGSHRTRSFTIRLFSLAILLIAVWSLAGLFQATAQDVPAPAQTDAVAPLQVDTETPTPTPTPTSTPTATPTQTPQPITVSGTSPSVITSGQSGILTITGARFTPATVVELIGVGNLSTSFVSSNELRSAIPSTLAPGQYIIKVSDTVVGGVSASFTLTVVAPPPPTTQPAPPTATIEPTQVPGAPNLLVRSFVASPSTIQPGGTVTFNFEVFNQGSRVAQGVSLAVDSGGKFVAANGQSNVLLPDIGVNGYFPASISVVAAEDTPGGPQSVSITMSFRDFTGQTYSSKGVLSVNVESVSRSSQITLSRYLADPNPVVPGQSVTLTVLLTNTGNEMAQQVLVSVGTDGILLAGPEGNSFPVGDLKAGASASVDMPLVVSSTAKAGPQSQTVSIAYLQKGESKNINASMTLSVAKVTLPAPIMLLESYGTGFDFLKPGQQFTLTLAVKNIGTADATGMLITFGTVDASGSDATPGASTTTSTNPSNTFAPLGSGGTLYAGDIDAGGDPVTLTQDFIVSGSVDSGVYSLPITLRYGRADGSNAQDNLRASLVVIVPPQIRITQTNPIPPTANVGEAVSFTLEIANQGRRVVNLTTARVTGENAEPLNDADIVLGPVQTNDSTTLDGGVIPSAVGPVTVNVIINYTDDLNQPQSLTETYTFEAVEPPPPPDNLDTGGSGGPIIPTPEPETDSRDLLGRLLLGLFGLGS